MGVGLEFFGNYSFAVGIALITGAITMLLRKKQVSGWWIFILGSVFLAVAAFVFGWTYPKG